MTTYDYEEITVHRDGALAEVVLNRPAVLNALSPSMSAELLDAITVLSKDRAVRAVLLRGAGRAFCAGADLTTRAADERPRDGDARSHLDDVFHPIVLAVRGAPKPFVAAVSGPCVGLGVAMALACDLVLADTSAYFLLPFVRLGLSLDGGISAFLADRIGLSRAAELTMLGERLAADQAAKWGMINRVCEPPSLIDEAHALASRLAAGPTLALANIKVALSSAAHPRLTDQLRLESALQRECVASDDYAEGRSAFSEHRQPVFDVTRTTP